MKQLTINGNRILLVEVPEGAVVFILHGVLRWDFGIVFGGTELLPSTSEWQFLFASPLNPTEEEAAGVVEQVSGWSSVIYYNYMADGRDYRDIVEAAFDNPIYSWNSFVTSHGFTPGRVVGMIDRGG